MASATWPGRGSGPYRADAAELEFAGMIVPVAEIVVTDEQSQTRLVLRPAHLDRRLGARWRGLVRSLDSGRPHDAETRRRGDRDIGIFLEFIAILVSNDAFVFLADDITAYGEVRWPMDIDQALGADLVESVGNCSSICLRDLGVKRMPGGVIRKGWLVGQQSSIRYLCSYADPLLPASAIFESRRVRIDYRPFARLWKRPIPIKESVPPEQWIERRLFASGVGSTMAELHLDYLLPGDTHRDHFVHSGPTDVALVDLEDLRMLYRLPSIEQCAASMVPLMSTLVYPEEWGWFRDGYIVKRGADGFRVFDLIEYRDFTGWMPELRRKSYDRAVDLLREQLDADGEVEDEANAQVFGTLGYCFGMTARFEEAEGAYRHGIALAQFDRETLARLMFGLAQVHLWAGRAQDAERVLEQILEREGEHSSDSDLTERVNSTLRSIRNQRIT
jgi:tetratricopeptide (TPR) repeat protein